MLSFLIALQTEPVVKRPIDDGLILRIAQNDMEAFRELYDSVSGSVYGFALSIVKNSHDADDVLQETFLKVHSGAVSYIPKGKPMAWIFTIARNLALTKLRENSKKAEFDEAHPEVIDTACLSNAEQRVLIEMLFRLLTDEEKQILILHTVSGMKHREIAEILSIPLSTVLSKYHRAIKRLKAFIEEENK